MADVPHADLIGKPFVWGGRGPNHYDCYGLVVEMHRRRGIELPEYTSPMNLREIAVLMEGGRPFWVPCEEQPGAIVAIRLGGLVCHVGYVLGDDYMLHTWERSGGVLKERLSVWQTRIEGFYRFAQ